MVRSILLLCSMVAIAHGFQMASPLKNIQSASFVSDYRLNAGAAVTLRKPLRTGVPAMKLPEVNTQAPSFKLPDSTGKLVGLDNFKGKWTVLYFYPKAFTQGCTCQAEGFQKDASEIRKLGAEIVGVSTDPVSKLDEFAKAYGLTFPLLSDENGKTAEAYGSALKLPFVGTFANRKTFIIDPKSQLRFAFDSVDAKKSSSDVIAKLKELQA